VVLLEEPLSEEDMAEVASEVNQAETAFLVPGPQAWGIRWLTPTVEVDLCGHATLASAAALERWGKVQRGDAIAFDSRSGRLQVDLLIDGRLALNFPQEPAVAEPLPFVPQAVWTGRTRMDWMAVLGSAEEVERYEPDMAAIASLGMRGLILTAPGDGGDDVVSRFFAPQSGVPEDHVTGSAHCSIGPWWQRELGKDELVCRQASPRGGRLWISGSVRLEGQARVRIQGDLSLCR
jgi:predicted PhzF superfamily epimerase YddE/YHI9